MADTTTTVNMKPGTPPASAAETHSFNAADGASKHSGDASQTSSGLPPITKEAMSTTGAPLVPTNPITQTKVPTPPPEPVLEPTQSSSAPKEEAAQLVPSESELKDKHDAANTLGQQPDKPSEPAVNAEPVPVNAVPSTQEATASVISNGVSQDAPKPVSVQEVRDETAPAPPPVEKAPEAATEAAPTTDSDTAPAKPAESALGQTAAPITTGTSLEKPVQAAPAETASAEVAKPVAEVGDKRKADDSEVVNGGDDADEQIQEEPAEKKQKTNGEESEVAPRKVGRPKKDKSATAEKKKEQPAPIGRTARKTRSQGAAELV